MPPNPPAPQAAPPRFAGFVIKEYTSSKYEGTDANALWNLTYSPSGATCSSPCDRSLIHRFGLKVEYPVGMVDPTTFPPSVFAVLYSGDPGEDDTMVLPLVSAAMGPAPNTTPVTSQKYNAEMPDVRRDHQIALQQRNPRPDLQNFYYGFLQLDYHFDAFSYQAGTYTIGVMLGWGPVKAQPDNWTDPILCQWQITPPT
ncbi:hypothetical protein [Methanoregula sp.]|uniref:hypothetical protein n=1 Tax=Methanoregula sp. TaxID=2052170 RepID=UPI002CC565DD|nr:hypothetical protein [Methanoregula sp.]HVP97053.1 hypothetical protein [Methanoregula sp.]